MAAKTQKPVARGFVNNIILKSLINGDKYGYEIIKEVEQKSKGEIVLKQPSLYSSLKRFEAKGYITSYWGDSDIGGRRHYYTITETGKNYYNSIKEPDNSFNDEVKNEDATKEIIVKPAAESKAESKNDNEQTISDESKEVSNIANEISELKDKVINIKNGLKNDVAEITTSNEITENEENEEDETYNIFDLLEKSQPENKIVKSKHIKESADNIKIEATKNEIDEKISEEEIKPEEAKEIEIANLQKNEIAEKEIAETNDKLTDTVIKTKSSEETNSEFAIQAEMFSKEATSPEIFTEQEIDTTSLQQLKEENALEPQQPASTSIKTIPLIKEREQEFFNWEELKRKIALKSEAESNKLNNETKELNLSEKTEFEKAVLNEHNTNPTLSEDTKQVTKKEVKIIVDEYGILKSSDDSLPKKSKQIFDNVGIRLENKDPINLNKPKKNHSEEIKFDINTHPVAEFNEQSKILENKINKAVQQQKSKTNEINFKNIMGDILVDENTVANTKKPDKILEDKATELQATENFSGANINLNKKIKVTSYTALETALKANGITFKPYSYEVNETKKIDFVLVNKVKFHFGLLLFLLLALQTTIFSVTLSNVNYAFKKIDYILMGTIIAIGFLIASLFTLPYLFNSKKRKFNDFNYLHNLFFGFLAFFAFAIITYAINSFVGLTVNNIKDYIFTLFLPILVFTNFIISPILFNVMLNNKKYY